MREFAGLRIVADLNWPREFAGYETYRSPAHPFIIWLSRYLPITPYIEGQTPSYRDRDPLIVGGTVFCSPRQYAELRARAK